MGLLFAVCGGGDRCEGNEPICTGIRLRPAGGGGAATAVYGRRALVADIRNYRCIPLYILGSHRALPSVRRDPCEWERLTTTAPLGVNHRVLSAWPARQCGRACERDSGGCVVSMAS